MNGASGNDLKNINVKFPLGTFTCVTGVSGGGKSTLVLETLWKSLSRNKLKKVSSGLPISLDDPIELLRFNDKFSVPLKIFLMLKLVPNEIPKSSILEWVKSRSNPRLNLSLGRR